MIALNLHNEINTLEAVVLGLPDSFGGTPKLQDCYDPKSREHVLKGTFPTQQNVIDEMNAVKSVLLNYGVEVFQPNNIEGLNQIFSRDIGFVIDNKFIVSNIIDNRKEEVSAIDTLIENIRAEDIIPIPTNARVEGGDVMLCDDFIFVGYSEEADFHKYQVARTNRSAVDFLQYSFPYKKVKGFELKKSDENPKDNALHLDCCFQPVGQHYAIMYKEGFKNQSDIDFLINHFGEVNIIFISRDEMYNMNTNIFSISPQVVISEKGFERLNKELRNKGITVEEVPYAEIAKMEGLLRCSTLPLRRK
tara:strand:+ start:144 stop:1058 length:915 start_codon:yes stop_codon:yes gene_type:complete